MAGQKSWIPMPETAGMSAAEASAMLKEKGFKKVMVEQVDRSGCEPSIVCDSSVKAGKRGYFDTPKTLFVGTDPTDYPAQERKPPTTPTEETQETPSKGAADDMEGGKAKPKPFF
jgi:beta-lactam-binding protein with PASTA domain